MATCTHMNPNGRSIRRKTPNCVFSRTAGDFAVLNQSLLAAAG